MSRTLVVGITGGSPIDHAAVAETMDSVGFAQAACRRDLWVSVEHTSVGETSDRDGTRVWRLATRPMLATPEPFRKGGEEGYDQVGQRPSCLRCQPIVDREVEPAQGPVPPS